MAVTDDAIEKIKTMITSGHLKPGDRLPREADLATEFGVSRSSLREAVRALSLVRILEVRRGDGTYVTSLQPEVLLDSMTFLLDFHQDSSVLDFLGVRRILEPAATALAAQHASPQDVIRLREMSEQDSTTTDVTELVDHDIAFHRAIAACSGNQVLVSLIDSIALPTVRARVWRGLTQQDACARTIAEHSAIVDAIEAHDIPLAQALATSHISGVQNWLERVARQGAASPELEAEAGSSGRDFDSTLELHEAHA
ncbi:FadR family transcriptional regulator [Micrococcales bacterium 31B]|nr:FadR family transcriptional regulator [Micrococcales bacterium 31B]